MGFVVSQLSYLSYSGNHSSVSPEWPHTRNMPCPEDSIPQLSRFSSFYSLSASSSVMFSKPEIGDSNDPLITEHSASPYTQHFNQLRLCSYHHPLQEEASLTNHGMLAATFRTLADFWLLLFQYWRPATFYLPPEPPLINISSALSLRSQASTDWSTFAFSCLWFWDLHSSF